MTHNTREWEKEFDEQFKGAIQLKNKPDGVTVTRLKHFIHQELQKAREDGYNAGLADGTNKPLLAIEQIREERDTYWKERVMAILEDVLDREYQKRNPPKKHNYLESFMWDIHKAFMKDITNEDNLK